VDAQLNAALVKELRRSGWLRSERIAEAFEVVRRGWFVPARVARQEAYDNEIVFTDWAADGSPLSSVSAPWLVAGMLERLAPSAGDRVLEVGSGGWNAALLRHLVGAEGRVTSIDIDPAVIERARDALAGTPWRDVHLVEGDGRAGFPDDAPYNGIMVTVEASAIEEAWLNQLCTGGRLVAPLRVRGMSRLLTFSPEGGHWRGGGWERCGFVRMRGQGTDRFQGTTFPLGDRVRLRVHDSELPDGQMLAAAAGQGRREAWSGVTVGVTEGTRPMVDLWLATALDRFGRLHADGQQSAGTEVMPLPGGSSATWNSTTLAYVTMRPADDSGTRYEYGVAWHGPDPQVAAQVIEHLRAWDREQRGGRGPSLMLYREGAAPAEPRGRVLDRPGPRMIITWP
jgi:protein-L-isoaspartate(D-aspartate) O-methyltransferase